MLILDYVVVQHLMIEFKIAYINNIFKIQLVNNIPKIKVVQTESPYILSSSKPLDLLP